MRLQNAIDGARYVEYLDDCVFASWTGGHTVNIYRELVDTYNPEVVETTCINVGSFERKEATLQEVVDGIQTFKENPE